MYFFNGWVLIFLNVYFSQKYFDFTSLIIILNSIYDMIMHHIVMFRYVGLYYSLLHIKDPSVSTAKLPI